jgi:small subunit ribosomal protein S9
LTESEHPEDEQRPEPPEAAAEEVPAETAEAPVQETPVEEPVQETPVEEPVQEPVQEAPAQETSAETPQEPAPSPAAQEAPEQTSESPAPAAETPAPAVETPAPAAETPAPAAETPAPAPAPGEGEADEEVEIAPRARPEIPGADLIPDIVAEGDEFLDAEARAAAEAEAEAAAARAQEQDSEEESRPIADAAIDLAAGARYTATGKRKTAVARVILKPGTGSYVINGKELDSFFPRDTLRRIIRQPLEAVGYDARMDVVARMHGGGVAAQAGALRHGISRALLEADPNLRGELKRRGFLTRDPRVKERKKAGLKKARKRPQFSKR